MRLLHLTVLALALPIVWTHSCHNPSTKFCTAVNATPTHGNILPWERTWFTCPMWQKNCVSGAYTECHLENEKCLCSNRRYAVESCPGVCEGLAKNIAGFCICPQFNANCYAAGDYCGVGDDGQCHCPATCT